jgi:hypothetical protein
MSAFPKTTTCANIVFPVKRGGRPILANRQLRLAAHRPRAQACARSLARTSRQAGPRASINAPVARHVSPHARTYAHTRAPQLARGVRHHSRHALLRSCVPSADRRPHGACVTDAHRPVSTHRPLPRRALVRRAIGCVGQCTASSVEHTWHAGDPRPTRVPADRTAQRSLARIIGSNFGAIFYAPCRWAMVCTSVLPESPTSQASIPRMLLTAGRQCITPTLNCGGTLASHLVIPCAVYY